MPVTVKAIAENPQAYRKNSQSANQPDNETNETKKDQYSNHNEYLRCFKFFAEMINRFWFMLITMTLLVAFGITIIPLYVQYKLSDQALIDQLNDLENQN